MTGSDRGQVTNSAAEVYEELFVPALFEQWTRRVADAAWIKTGQQILDVGCGTGVLARQIAERLGQDGSVIGIDPNEGMLTVARRKAPQIEWRQGFAETLPFSSNNFDAVVCQFGLMYFENPRRGAEEMMRVLRPAGRLAVAVWGSLEDFPGYTILVDLLQRLFSDRAAESLRAPFRMGDVGLLSALFGEAGVPDAKIEMREGTARFPSIRSWLFTEVKGWVLADMLDDAQFELLLREAEKILRPFVTPEGTFAFAAPAYIVTATKV
jgi:SAM-dependent methyltransferase